jgi:hypothetical protein
MSHYAIISNVTLELRRQIFEALQATPDADFQVNDMIQDIIFDPPPDAAGGPPVLSIFLYHIEPDGHLRNQPHLTPGPNGLRYPPLALQLYYLITPLDTAQERNQLLLGRILQHFHDNPMLTAIDGTPLDNSFGGNSPEMRIILETLTLEELSRVWYALSSTYQLSVAYKVRVVTVDSLQPESAAHRVTELHAIVGHKGENG